MASSKRKFMPEPSDIISPISVSQKLLKQVDSQSTLLKGQNRSKNLRGIVKVGVTDKINEVYTPKSTVVSYDKGLLKYLSGLRRELLYMAL